MSKNGKPVAETTGDPDSGTTALHHVGRGVEHDGDGDEGWDRAAQQRAGLEAVQDGHHPPGHEETQFGEDAPDELVGALAIDGADDSGVQQGCTHDQEEGAQGCPGVVEADHCRRQVGVIGSDSLSDGQWNLDMDQDQPGDYPKV